MEKSTKKPNAMLAVCPAIKSKKELFHILRKLNVFNEE